MPGEASRLRALTLGVSLFAGSLILRFKRLFSAMSPLTPRGFNHDMAGCPESRHPFGNAPGKF
jgi:hypothetical protein